MKRPESPGEVVTSTCPTEMPRSSLQLAKSAQIGFRALHAGHHGAKLENIKTINILSNIFDQGLWNLTEYIYLGK